MPSWQAPRPRSPRTPSTCGPRLLAASRRTEDAAKNSGGLGHLRPERRRPALAQATHPTQRHFNGSSTLVRDRGHMTTRWTFRLARVWAAQFTASGPEDYADYADCDADPRRHSPRARNMISAGRTDLASQPSPRSIPTSIRLGPATGRPGQQGTTLPTLRKRLTEQLHDSDGGTVPHRRQNRRTTKPRCRRFRSGNSR